MKVWFFFFLNGAQSGSLEKYCLDLLLRLLRHFYETREREERVTISYHRKNYRKLIYVWKVVFVFSRVNFIISAIFKINFPDCGTSIVFTGVSLGFMVEVEPTRVKFKIWGQHGIPELAGVNVGRGPTGILTI